MTSDAERSAVVVQYTKYPDAVHWRHDMQRLGEDEHGVWLGTLGGTFEKPGTVVEIDIPFVQLIAPGRWWTLLHNGSEHRFEHYVDMCTPVCWIDDAHAETIDLDLDVVRLRDGGIDVLDEDEFAAHQALHAYPPELIDGARRGCIEVVRLMQQGAEPFATRAQAWRAYFLGTAPAPV